MARKRVGQTTSLPAPYLKRVWIDTPAEQMPRGYPFNLNFLNADFEISFREPVTIIVGENGVGKSTLLEGIAALAGYDAAGGGKGYRAVSHETAQEANGDRLASVLRASWLPRVTNGWFFRAESFFSVARYLDEAARGSGPPPDYLSHSHGEGFLRFFEERCQRQGIYFFDEPESALSPSRQIEFLKLMRRMRESTLTQIVMATHSPLLMAFPGAQLMMLSWHGLIETRLEDTSHFQLLQEFYKDPRGFVETMIES
jgi:predicted ATPase